jgi:hypothetical protein
MPDLQHSFKLDTPAGHSLARQLLKDRIPHPLHDYVIEDVCKAIDGFHVLSVVRTGGGKSSYFYAYMHLLQALKGHPCYNKPIPDNPLMIVVYPTKGLEEEQVRD